MNTEKLRTFATVTLERFRDNLTAHADAVEAGLPARVERGEVEMLEHVRGIVRATRRKAKVVEAILAERVRAEALKGLPGGSRRAHENLIDRETRDRTYP